MKLLSTLVCFFLAGAILTKVASAQIPLWKFNSGSGSFTGLSSSDYQSMFNVYVDDGNYPTRLRGYYDQAKKAVLYDVTFSPNPPGQAFEAHHGINSATFFSVNSRLRAQGYSLATHSAFYDGNGELLHAAVWTKAG